MIDSRIAGCIGIAVLRCIMLFLLLSGMCVPAEAQQVYSGKLVGESRSHARALSEQVYVDPTMWSGVLVLHSGLLAADAELPREDAELLSAALSQNSDDALLVLAPATRAALDRSGILVGHESQANRLSQAEWSRLLNDGEAIEKWRTCKSIWIDVDRTGADAILKLEAAAHERLQNILEEVLASGGLVRISGDLSWLGIDRARNRTMLLANCSIQQSDEVTSTDAGATAGGLVQLTLLDGLRCVFAKRQLINVTKGKSLDVTLSATAHYSAPLKQTLRDRQSIDWVQWQRALLERDRAEFPGKNRVQHGLSGGSLVIGGGGGMPEDVWKRFVELAGGEQARIVILPTAVEDPNAEPSFEARVMKQAGAEHIVTLPQIARKDVEEAAFLQELDRATGVWFGGGRQWRFVDAYWGTAAWARILDVCNRGGVIGGSSAGATIQGDLLVRGAPAGNQIMIADGYRQGFGLLPGVAIDQHFAQRSRFKELENCLAPYPAIFGVGIDEQTALIVTGSDDCEVLGAGSVWLYPSYDVGEIHKADAATRAAMRHEFKSGSVFQLSDAK